MRSIIYTNLLVRINYNVLMQYIYIVLQIFLYDGREMQEICLLQIDYSTLKSNKTLQVYILTLTLQFPPLRQEIYSGLRAV